MGDRIVDVQNVEPCSRLTSAILTERGTCSPNT